MTGSIDVCPECDRDISTTVDVRGPMPVMISRCPACGWIRASYQETALLSQFGSTASHCLRLGA